MLQALNKILGHCFQATGQNTRSGKIFASLEATVLAESRCAFSVMVL
jgi:hypothetical protein